MKKHGENTYSFHFAGIAIMATIKLASNLALDKEGYAYAKLSVIETIKPINANNGNKRTLVKDEHFVECLELIFVCANTMKGDMEIKTAIFGLTVNPNPLDEVRIGKKLVKTYNKFTTVLLALGIVDKEEIDKARNDITVLDVDTITALILAVKDLPVRFKPQKNAKGFIEPNLLTLELLDDNQKLS